MATSSNLRSLNFQVKNRSASNNTPTGNIFSSSTNIQAKMVLNSRENGQAAPEFVFPFAPIDIQYSNLAAEWTDIARPGRTPLVEFVSNKLLNVSFKFLVARPFDGLFYSVDDSLRILRFMASSQKTVSFFGFDGMLTNPFQIDGQPTRSNSGFYFHITDFSISSLRRNSSNEITAAECSITVTEVNNPDVTVVQFPVITYPVPVVPTPKKKTPPPPGGVQMTAEELKVKKETEGYDWAGFGWG